MKATTILSAALVAASQIYTSLAVGTPIKRASILRPSAIPIPGASISQGCYKSKGNMTMVNLNVACTSAACNTACEEGGYYVLALYGGQCFGGFAMPPVDDYVSDDSKCNSPCPGYDQEACGGGSGPGAAHFYSVYNRGIDVNPPVYTKPKPTTSAAESSTSAPKSTKTSSHSDGQETTPAVVTETPRPSETDGSAGKDKKGPNTAGIAAGVVVGVVVLGALAGGIVFFMRRKRNAAIEEEHRRNAAVNAFISGSNPPSSHGSISMTDSRLDPVMAHRRMSDGSIADNEDYSRRILRVTNA